MDERRLTESVARVETASEALDWVQDVEPEPAGWVWKEAEEEAGDASEIGTNCDERCGAESGQ